MAHDLMFGKTRRDWSCGSIVLPAKQQRAIFNKIDDVRYDLRRAGRAAGAGLIGLAAALGLVAVSGIYRTHHEGR